MGDWARGYGNCRIFIRTFNGEWWWNLSGFLSNLIDLGNKSSQVYTLILFGVFSKKLPLKKHYKFMNNAHNISWTLMHRPWRRLNEDFVWLLIQIIFQIWFQTRYHISHPDLIRILIFYETRIWSCFRSGSRIRRSHHKILNKYIICLTLAT